MNAILHFFARLVDLFVEYVRGFSEKLNISQFSSFQIAADILLVAVVFYWLIQLIRGSRATNIMFGLLGVFGLLAMSRFLNLLALGWLLDRLLTVILVAIPIIFQQELRRGLEKLGRTKFFLAQEAKEIDFLRSELISAMYELAKRRLGGLVVFRGEVNLKEYIDTGVLISARVSKELLLAIFAKESPLHDGALIIDQNRLIAGGCVLPHSFKEYGHRFGTRHKAALALSEATDAKIFVISEERGSVSFVADGELMSDVHPERAEKLLTEILQPKKHSYVQKLRS